MKRGFTLIELSIVLIIIGLLVGGVLAGRDLIRQAELSGFQRDISNYRTAVRTFQLKYGENVIPGDFDNANAYWSATADGNGDGRLLTNDERADFWQQLSLSGLIDGNYTGVLGSDADTFNAENRPSPGLGGALLAMNTTSGTYYGQTYLELGNFYMFGAPRASDGVPGDEIISAIDAYTIDAKSDDGQADTGLVLTQKGYAGSSYHDNCVANNPGQPTSGAYDFSTDEVACRLWILFE